MMNIKPWVNHRYTTESMIGAGVFRGDYMISRYQIRGLCHTTLCCSRTTLYAMKQARESRMNNFDIGWPGLAS